VRAFALILVLLVLAGAFLAPREKAIFPVVALADQPVVYVSPDQVVFTMLPNGTDRDRITSSVPSGGVLAQPSLQEAPSFTWPTWSPDGTQLVVSHYADLGRRRVAALTLIEPPSSEETYLQITRRGQVDRVAEGTFHFPLWSPDGAQLALIAPNDSSTALLLTVGDVVAREAGRAVGVAVGGPIYLTWSPDSTLMAIHHRDRLLFKDDQGELFDTARSSIRYRVPAVSSDSASIAYVADLGDGERLIARTISTGEERELVPVRTEAAFAFSPADPEVLAVVVRAEEASAAYAGISLVNAARGGESALYEETVYAFWWSPDGTKIALVSTSPDSFTWVIVDIATSEATTLAHFIPTPEFTTYMQFFDQFGLAQDIWSADSTAITFAGHMASDGESAPDDAAWVLDVTGEQEATSLAQASLAFFVPVDLGRE
jgi:TolB protein